MWHPAIFSGYRFFDKRSQEKNPCAAGESVRDGGHLNPSSAP